MEQNKRITAQSIYNLALHNPDLDILVEQILAYLSQVRQNRNLQAENLYIDFKSAKFFERENFKAPEIRKDVASFANSEGGLIIYGVDESNQYSLETCDSPKGTDDPANALRNAYQNLAPYIYPKPQTHTLSIGESIIVVTVIPRSEVLVPVLIQGSLKYFLRIGSSTGTYERIESPNYLVEDLLSQRRNRPSFSVQLRRVKTSDLINGRSLDLKLELAIENISLNWAKGGVLGIVYYQRSENIVYDIDQELPKQVELAIDIKLGEHKKSEEQKKRLERFSLCITHQEIKEFKPFQAPIVTSSMLRSISLTRELGNNWGNLQAAIFIAPQSYSPSWFQLELDEDFMKKAYNTLAPITVDSFLEQVPRPIVSVT